MVEHGVELGQLLLPLHLLDALRAVAREEDPPRRLQFLRLNLVWSTILGIAVGVSAEEKMALRVEGEAAFRNDHPCRLRDYFSDTERVMRHWLMAHNLYWTLHPQRVNEPWPILAMVMRFFRPEINDYPSADEHMGVIERVLDTFPRHAQSEGFCVAVGFYRYSNKELNARYASQKKATVLHLWCSRRTPVRKDWTQPPDCHWNLSRVWFEGCMEYVDAMMAAYDVRIDFSQHSVRAAYPGRQVVAVLSLGRRPIYYAGEDVEAAAADDHDDAGGGGLLTHRAMEHCSQWMMGTAHGALVSGILAMKGPTATMYRELLRVLFFRRLRVQYHWNAAASRGQHHFAEGRFIGHLVFLEKKEKGK